MPLYTVPKFLEVEMKIAGPFTFKQFLIILLAIGGLILAFNYLPRSFFFLFLFVFVAAIFVFNLIKVEGVKLYEVLFEGIIFLFSPKVIFWEKEKTRQRPIFQETTFELAKPKKDIRFRKGGKLEKMKLYIQTQG